VYGSLGHSPDYLQRGRATYAYIHNHLGSVKYVVDVSSGAVAQRLDYDEWGQVVADSSPGFQPFGFAGGVYDVDTALTHFGYRDYDARYGVWTSKDPIRLAGGWGEYAYVGNDPLRHLDSVGLYFRYVSSAAWGDLYWLSFNWYLGAEVQRMAADPIQVYDVYRLSKRQASSILKYTGGGRCVTMPDQLNHHVIQYSPEYHAQEMPLGIEPRALSTERLLAHELGEALGAAMELDPPSDRHLLGIAFENQAAGLGVYMVTP
jgi:RHS repeat-associated protein